MPIREESFRIGCGRYIQGSGYTNKLGEEVARLGRAPLVMGGATALSLTRGKIVAALFPFCDKYEFITHTGTCNEEDAKKIAEYALAHEYDVIVGVGGGVLMDFAKLCSHFAEIPVVNMPTSSASSAELPEAQIRPPSVINSTRQRGSFSRRVLAPIFTVRSWVEDCFCRITLTVRKGTTNISSRL